MLNSPFDQLANKYDAEFTHTGVGRVLREIVWARYDELLQPGLSVLELGCGTGEDALHLAQRGVHVVATDAAGEMVDIARYKAARHGCADRVEFHAVAMERVAQQFAERRFDGVISNFGAINCVNDLARLASGVASLLKPGAPLLWVVMGKHVPWEWFWYSGKGQLRKAFRRYRSQGVEWRGLTVRYPTPRRLSHYLSPHFRVSRLAPLGCVLPPSYAAGWLNRRTGGLNALASLERFAQRSSWLASVADHYVIEAYRRPA